MGSREDALVGFHFALDAGEMASGYFTEISGIGSETEVVEHQVVTEAGVDTVFKIPGRLKWGEITLKRGITSNMDCWTWRKMVEDGDVAGARTDGSIIMYDQTLTEVARWNFERGWPSKIDGPQFSADGNSIGIEEITIVHEYIVRES